MHQRLAAHLTPPQRPARSRGRYVRARRESFTRTVDLSGSCRGDSYREAECETSLVLSSGADAWGDCVD